MKLHFIRFILLRAREIRICREISVRRERKLSQLPSLANRIIKLSTENFYISCSLCLMKQLFQRFMNHKLSSGHQITFSPLFVLSGEFFPGDNVRRCSTSLEIQNFNQKSSFFIHILSSFCRFVDAKKITLNFLPFLVLERENISSIFKYRTLSK